MAEGVSDIITGEGSGEKVGASTWPSCAAPTRGRGGPALTAVMCSRTRGRPNMDARMVPKKHVPKLDHAAADSDGEAYEDDDDPFVIMSPTMTAMGTRTMKAMLRKG